MNAFEVCAAVMLVALVLAAVVAVRGALPEAVVALEAVSVTVVLVFALLAEGFGRSGETELPLVMALLTLGASLVYVRYLGGDR